MQLIIFAFIFLGEFLTSPKTLLFYDQIEYLSIVSTHSFWQVFSLGHFPIHPFFLSIFWLTSRLTLPNYTAFIFGVVSAVLMYVICKKIIKGKYFWIPSVIFLLFPGVWLVNTNLMIQSILLTIYLFAIHFFLSKKPLLFAISIFLMMGIHVDAVYWTLSIFLLPFIFKDEINLEKKEILKFFKLGILSIVLSVIFYALIYLLIRKDFGGSTEQIFAYSSFGLFRIIRNIWVGIINNFGSITPFLLTFLLIKNVRSKSSWISWIILALLVSIGGAYWAGDLMMRRMVFVGVIMSLAFYKYMGKKSILLIIFLLPITAFNAASYYKNLSDMPLEIMQQKIDVLPKNQVLIQSHYYYPFTKYDGKILWFETGDMDQIDEYLKIGTRVFMPKEAVTAPYLLIVGNNYHITSLAKTGNSESRFLFEKYILDRYLDSFELRLSEEMEVSKEAGQPVVFYGTGFPQRLSRLRINYGDVGIWVWAVITNHKDAIGWTYKDARGVWLQI
jgi:hypothetical protein